jgi:uncharacterized protein
MLIAETQVRTDSNSDLIEFKPITLQDRQLIISYVERFKPLSCEYNFANLFAWKKTHDFSYAHYQGRLLIYDKPNKCFFMPLGKNMSPEELADLSLNLAQKGYSPKFGLFTPEYLKLYPDIKNAFNISSSRDHAEYIYEVESLCVLSGDKLHKKKNLITQFKRNYPDYRVHRLSEQFRAGCLKFARSLLNRQTPPSHDLIQEITALEISFHYYEELGLEGRVLTVNDKIVAFSVFSRLNKLIYNVQFEKSSFEFKGAAQVINHETAKALRPVCEFVNREQDLGLKGLRQAKMSYDPVKLLVPHTLEYIIPN